MLQLPKDHSPESWHRFFAMEGNNRAWDLANEPANASGIHELLNAAHASAWHWQAVGTELNHMRARMLLAEVHALAGHGSTALAYAGEMRGYFLGKGDTPDWELAFAHAIFAHAAHTAGRPDLHGPAHQSAASAVAAIAGDEDRAIVLQVFRRIPAP